MSYLYVLLGQLPLIESIFVGLKAAVLAVVVKADVRVGSRTLKHNVMRRIAVAAFVAIFFLDAPFPLILLAAGVGGYIGGRSGLPQFAGGGGHGPAGGDIVHDLETARGEALPDHA